MTPSQINQPKQLRLCRTAALLLTSVMGLVLQACSPLTYIDPSESKIGKLIFTHGYFGEKFLAEQLRGELLSLMATKGVGAFKAALVDAGADCVDRSDRRRQCVITKSQIMRNMDIFFPKYSETTWRVAVSFKQFDAAVTDLDVVVSTQNQIVR